MKTTLFNFLVYILPIVIAALTQRGVEWLKAINTWLDARGPVFKQIFVGVFSFVLTSVTSWLMVKLTGNAITDVGLILSAALPYIFHLGQQASQIKARVGADAAPDRFGVE